MPDTAEPGEGGCIRDYSDGDPFPYYDRRRLTAPVHWDESVGGWMLMSYSDCAYVGQHDDTFQVPWNHLPGGVEVLGRYGLFNLQGSSHRNLHSFLLRYFQTGVEGSLRNLVAAKVNQLADEIVGRGRCEFAGEFADQLASRVIMAVLGLPDDAELLRDLFAANQAVKLWIESYGEAGQTAHAVAAREVFARNVVPIALARRRKLNDDLISALWVGGRREFPDWNEHDMVGYVLHLFGAGSETTATLLSNIAHVLVEMPAPAIRLKADGVPASRLVEEVLRCWAPAHVRVREAAEEVALGGVRIQAGDRVHPVLASANRDVARFSEPGDFDLDRSRPKQHLSFYLGERFCVGAPLARLEGTLVTETLISRFPGLRHQPGAPVARYHGFSFRTFRPLHVCWDVNGERN
jgi:cytochrome P450